MKAKYSCNDCSQQGAWCVACTTKIGEPPSHFVHKEHLVDHPPHYTTGNIETIEYIEDKLTPEMLEGYFVGNIIKYLSRYRHKNGVEDLKKARWYLDRMIGRMGK